MSFRETLKKSKKVFLRRKFFGLQSAFATVKNFRLENQICPLPSVFLLGTVHSTGNDRYSGHGYSGIDRYSGTKTPDDAILFTVSGITAIVEQKFRKFRFFEAQSFKRPLIFSKKTMLKLMAPHLPKPGPWGLLLFK